MPIAIIVHGGAWEIPDALVEPHERGCRAAAEAGYAVLESGGAAIDAVEAAVRSLEDDPVFDAGLGGFLNAAGVVELDAGLMDGRSLRSAAVAAVSCVRHPVTLARKMLETTDDRLVVAHGAAALAAEMGVPTVDPSDLETPETRALWERTRALAPHHIFEPRPRGTVGAVALDATGNLVAATSTGGLPNKRQGRVGDTPVVGSGFFADEEAGGASATGHGEAILTAGLARLAVERLRAGDAPAEAARRALEALGAPRVAGRGGLILLDRLGAPAAAFTTSRMAFAHVREGGPLVSGCGA